MRRKFGRSTDKGSTLLSACAKLEYVLGYVNAQYRIESIRRLLRQDQHGFAVVGYIYQTVGPCCKRMRFKIRQQFV